MKYPFIFTVLFSLIFMNNRFFGQFTTIDYKVHNVGKIRQFVINMGKLDDSADDKYSAYRGLLWSEMPVGSDEEHIFQAGIWVG